MDNKKCWRKKAREFLAIAFGGKCTVCGYDKTIAALDYHHINPEEKDHLLSILQCGMVMLGVKLSKKPENALSFVVDVTEKYTLV